MTNQSLRMKEARSGFFAKLDALLDEQELAIVSDAKRFCEKSIDKESHDAFIENRAFSRELIDAWAHEGFLALQVPKEFGGNEASFLCKVRIAQEVALRSFATSFSLNNLQGSVTRIARNGSEKQREILLRRFMHGEVLGAPAMTEPNAGSDLGALQAEARRVDGGWLLSGHKTWVTNGTIVHFPLVLAKVSGCGEDDGKIASFLVDLTEPLPTYGRTELPTLGSRSFRSAEIEFREHYVPDWALFSPPGEAFKSSLTSINAARVHVGAMCTATLYACLCEAVSYCSSRRTFDKTLLDHQGLRWELAEVATRLEAANALVLLAAMQVNQHGDAVTIAAQAKKFAVDTAIWGIDQCVRCVGAVGVTPRMRLVMHQAEIRFASYADGTGQLLLDRIGKGLSRDYSWWI